MAILLPRRGALVDRYLPDVRPFPGVRPLVQQMRNRGWLIVIATSALSVFDYGQIGTANVPGKSSPIPHWDEICAGSAATKPTFADRYQPGLRMA